MQIFYSDHFMLPLPQGHRFPMAKYRLLRERILNSGLPPCHRLCVPEAATDEQLHLVHDAAYVKRVCVGSLSPAEIRRIGFPWSPQLVERSRRSVGGTIATARAALADGSSVNLAGGTHHAFSDRGEGFCVFNDVAVAARTLQGDGCRRVVIIDCDVHQGNGTAAIFAGDASVFTFSIHGANNFPFRKVAGDLDLSLPDGSNGATYHSTLRNGLDDAFERAAADLAIYLAGADPYIDDRYGKLALTREDLAIRDRLVFEACSTRRVPVATVMSGGYAPDVSAIVDIHFTTVQIASEYSRSTAPSLAAPGRPRRPASSVEVP